MATQHHVTFAHKPAIDEDNDRKREYVIADCVCGWQAVSTTREPRPSDYHYSGWYFFQAVEQVGYEADRHLIGFAPFRAIVEYQWRDINFITRKRISVLECGHSYFTTGSKATKTRRCPECRDQKIDRSTSNSQTHYYDNGVPIFPAECLASKEKKQADYEAIAKRRVI